jgi:FAD/FMN-containing dehydrogenase
LKRRDFLRRVLGASGLIAALPTGRLYQITKTKTEPEWVVVKKPGGVLVNDIHTELNPTLVDRIVYPNSLDAIVQTIHNARQEGKVICIAGSRHAMGAQQFAAKGVLIDMTALSRVIDFNSKEGTVEVEAGIQWPILISQLLKVQEGQLKGWGFAQKQTADWLSIGGSLVALTCMARGCV